MSVRLSPPLSVKSPCRESAARPMVAMMMAPTIW